MTTRTQKETTMHTPTPWKVNIGITDKREFIENGEKVICDLPDKTKESEANAEFIVQAVNAHDDLVKALESAKNYIRYLGENGMADDDAGAYVQICGEAIAKAAKV